MQGVRMILLVVFGVGVVAGFVDAIAGGGGLIMLPGLMFTGLPVGSAIATNKLCGTFGSLTSTLKFAQAQQVNWRACVLMGPPILLGAYLGSRSIGLLPVAWAEPMVILLMVAITLFTVFRPDFGTAQRQTSEGVSAGRGNGRDRIFWSVLAAIAIGFHDGFFGPGTGVFLVFTLLSLWPLDFLCATGTTKLLNFLANITALITFAMNGTIAYSIGIFGAVGVILGSFLGASFATSKGVKIIRPIFILVTSALVIRLLVS
ncbi:MAG: TSUP family transporter [Cyanobacteria bacterium J06614_10]